ncbi:MAG TPA: hypothetical protein VJT74_17535 [Pyrinomonadaceae bacterium]|nr:hypothetical protein [Pyrinomonadaceae bacterium]
MLQETVIWLTAISSLACVVKSWQEARKASLEVKKLKIEERQKILGAAQIEQRNIEPKMRLAGQQLLIDRELLEAVVEDIKNAQDKFIATIKDDSKTTVEIDAEYKRAQITICVHLKKIKELNKNRLPTEELKLFSESWCS